MAIRKRKMYTIDGFVEVDFDDLVWPHCVDYTLRDEATVERYTECMQIALDENFHWDSRKSREGCPALIDEIYKIADSLPGRPTLDGFNEFCSSLLEFCLTPHEWSRWTWWSWHGRNVRDLLREEDPRWRHLKVSGFDLIEENLLDDFGILIRSILLDSREAFTTSGWDDYPIKYPRWGSNSESDLEHFADPNKSNDSINDWGVSND